MNFSEKYRRANDRLHAGEDTLAAIKRRTAGEEVKGKAFYRSAGTPRRWSIAAASVVLAAAVVLAVLVPALGERPAAKPVIIPAAEIQTPQDYSAVYNAIQSVYYNNAYGIYYGSADDFREVGAINSSVMADGSIVFDEMAQEPAMGTAPTMKVEQSTDNLKADTAVSAGGSKHSETNVQVRGVDEGDIIKNDGRYIYILRRGTVTIVDAESMKELSSFRIAEEKDENVFNSEPHEMYVQGDRLVLLSNWRSYTPFISGTVTVTTAVPNETAEQIKTESSQPAVPREINEEQTRMAFFDISDRTAPRQLNVLSQSGYYASSRLVGDCLYTVSTYYTNEPDSARPETFAPNLRCDGEMTTMPVADICLPESPQEAAYTVVTSVKLGDSTVFAGQKAVFGGCGTVYADSDSLLVANYRPEQSSTETQEDGQNVIIETYSGSTELALFSLDDGAIGNVASGTVPGSLLNQFSMDEYKGYYRIVTTLTEDTVKIFTDGRDRTEYSNSSTNGLYVLDGGLNHVGKLDGLAEDERVYSVRFDGDIGYFVTFRQVDPLFAVDLSDPTAPTLLSALKIPGFSQYMHKYSDGLLFGLGMDADEETGRTGGMKLSMFDISNPADVTEKHTLKLDTYWSEALNNHKAILISAERNIIAFPTDGNGYVIYGYDEQSGFYERARIHTEENAWHYFFRGLFIGDVFYICNEAEVISYSIADFSRQGSLKLSELPEETYGKYMLID
ncbi:MAG: hypothetical protein E7559_01265 [Ruminococcaceae bacterium]|nr:hypothetical protein [Oscillospiraceae bacterium]